MKFSNEDFLFILTKNHRGNHCYGPVQGVSLNVKTSGGGRRGPGAQASDKPGVCRGPSQRDADADLLRAPGRRAGANQHDRGNRVPADGPHGAWPGADRVPEIPKPARKRG